jgi:type IV pilus assembly protein PilB
MPARLGQLLITSNIITEDQLKEALGLQRKEGGRLGNNLVKLGHITEEKLVAFLSRQYNVPAINLTDYKIDPSLLKLIPIDMARKYLIMPVARVGATITIAMVDPSNVFAIDDVKFRTGYNVEVVVSSESSILNAISTHYADQGESLVAAKGMVSARVLQAGSYTTHEEEFTDVGVSAGDDGPLVDVDEFDKIVGDALDSVEIVTDKRDALKGEVEEPVIKLVNGILVNAIKLGASDIHIEPYERHVRVRYRVDGVLFNAMDLPIKIKNSVTSRLKIMSKLDIAERRLPQDGRIKLRLDKKREIDFRVSVLPCLFGEKTVMRILDKSNLQVDLTKLGFEEEALQDHGCTKQTIRYAPCYRTYRKR